MILTDINIQQIIAERGLDWLIDNTKGIIKRYSKQPHAYGLVVKRYSKLLKKLYKIQAEQEEQKKIGTNSKNNYT